MLEPASATRGSAIRTSAVHDMSFLTAQFTTVKYYYYYYYYYIIIIIISAINVTITIIIIIIIIIITIIIIFIRIYTTVIYRSDRRARLVSIYYNFLFLSMKGPEIKIIFIVLIINSLLGILADKCSRFKIYKCRAVF